MSSYVRPVLRAGIIRSISLKLATATTLLAVILGLIAPAGAAPAAQPAGPGNTDGYFVVEDALAQFKALKHHGEALGWLLPEADGAPDPTLGDHYQGLVRYPGSGTPIFYVTQKDTDDEPGPGGTPGGYLHVMRFGSRPGDGERLRSNLQIGGRDTKSTTPDAADAWVRTLHFDGTFAIDGVTLPAYEHPGGMTIVDDILFMALDSPSENQEDKEPKEAPGQIILFDLADRFGREALVPFEALPLSHGIDNLAVTKQPDNSYLIWTNGSGGLSTHFYRPTYFNGAPATNLRDEGLSLLPIQVWDHTSPDDYDGAGVVWPGSGMQGDVGAHQSATFVREPDGTLFLIAMRNTLGSNVGDDLADLYRVEPKGAGGFKLVRLDTRRFYCNYQLSNDPEFGDGRTCNFAAAPNAYVSPSGELILYGVPHDDEDGFDTDIVRLAEFRHEDVSRENNPLRRPTASTSGAYDVSEGATVALSGSGSPGADGPWVELYDDTGFLDRSIVVDYEDHKLYELHDFTQLDGFGDKPSSLRWRLPVGLDIYLHRDNSFTGPYIILRGTGRTESSANLDDQVMVPGVIEHPARSEGEKLDFGDETSSMRFAGAPPAESLRMEWDLDNDGVFGETGAEAANGDEVGASVVFNAAGIDGPVQIPAVFRVSGPGGSAEASTTITVANVAPTATFARTPDRGDLMQRELLTLSFASPSDPSAADMAGLRYAYDCTGDGAFEAVDTTAAELVCAYPDAGAFTARGRISDGDGGSSEYTVTVTVISTVEAITRLVALVESFNLHQGIDNALDAKLQAAKNALDAADTNDNSAAVTALQDFINHVAAQSGKKITVEQANQLIAAAQRITNTLTQA